MTDQQWKTAERIVSVLLLIIMSLVGFVAHDISNNIKTILATQLSNIGRIVVLETKVSIIDTDLSKIKSSNVSIEDIKDLRSAIRDLQMELKNDIPPKWFKAQVDDLGNKLQQHIERKH